MNIFREPDITVEDEGYEGARIPQYTKLYCWLGNLLDFRYWFCKYCCYTYPWGLCHDINCKHSAFNHD